MKHCIHSNNVASLINGHITFYRKVATNVVQNSFHTLKFGILPLFCFEFKFILGHPVTFIRIYTVILASCNVSPLALLTSLKCLDVVRYFYDVVWRHDVFVIDAYFSNSNKNKPDA